ncbi:MAG TPA: hypothetical protein VFW35_04655 [Sphingomicrobium sp.]|nr:hypothetical protein [Sphingomicrobium sp.]
MQTIGLVALATLAASTFWTADDPFVGKWKLDVSRSTFVDQMRVEAHGPNRYAFNFEGAPTETIVADGTDQPGLPGTTLAVKSQDPHSLTVVRKQGGHVIISANWKLSPDGRILHDAFTGLQPDGSMMTVNQVFKRMSGTSGFAGLWESTTKPSGLKLELGIQPYRNEGLRFASPSSDNSVAFDGRDHTVPGAKDSLTLSGRRTGARVLEYTEKNQGKVSRARRFELSRDGRTLTETVHLAGQATPDRLVFERE